MSSTTQRIVSVFPNNLQPGSNDGLSFALSVNGNKWAASFVASEPITLAAVAFYIFSVTGTPVAYNIRIETDNGSGRPSGTLAWTNATATLSAGASAGCTAELALTASGTLSVGTLYHLVVTPATDPASANFISNNENGQWMVSSAGAGPAGSMQMYASHWNGTTWSTGSGVPVFVLVSSDASPKRIGLPYGGAAAGSLTLTNTAWAGAKFTAPGAITVWGVQLGMIPAATANVSCFLIDGSNNILATATLPTGLWTPASLRGPYLFVFSAPVTLVSGATYRIVCKDSAGAQRLDFAGIAGANATYADIIGGSNFMLTQGTSSDGTASPTSWTDTTTKVPHFELYGSGVTGGGGGGGNLLGNGTLVIA